MTPRLRVPRTDRPLLHGVQRRHPAFVTAVMADARLASARRGEPQERSNRMRAALQVLHLVWATDAFGALASTD